MRIYRSDTLVETPWKNGGGITRDIASALDGDAIIWRLSMADVSQAGPFSSFPGLTRILTVIDGGGMILHGPDGDLHADFAQPVTFDGATPIEAELTQGPLRDFNLMFDPRRCDGHAAAKHGPVDDMVIGGIGAVAVLHCITGGATVDGQGLAPGDTAIADDAPLRVSLPDGAVALAITLRDRVQTDANSPAIA